MKRSVFVSKSIVQRLPDVRCLAIKVARSLPIHQHGETHGRHALLKSLARGARSRLRWTGRNAESARAVPKRSRQIHLMKRPALSGWGGIAPNEWSSRTKFLCVQAPKHE